MDLPGERDWAQPFQDPAEGSNSTHLYTTRAHPFQFEAALASCRSSALHTYNDIVNHSQVVRRVDHVQRPALVTCIYDHIQPQGLQHLGGIVSQVFGMTIALVYEHKHINN
jgi:hypothetical protein